MTDALQTSDFDFYLPENLIAQSPLERRDESRLLSLNRKTGEMRHHHFYDMKSYLKKGDCLVLNNTRVIPARLFAQKKDTGAVIEIVLLNDKGGDVWECLVKPGKKSQPGTKLVFGDGSMTGEILAITEGGCRLIHFEYEGIFLQILENFGTMPLPPYIKETLSDQERYQTVYSKVSGSAAAPTAGLHFTNELLSEITDMGISIVYLTLHVGLGTFRPVKVKNILEHKMHSEFFSLDEAAAKTINFSKQQGGRVIAVGTTVCRTLETLTDVNGNIFPKSGYTDIFIYPGYNFKMIDALITNFHLPQSTLLMLVSAFSSRDLILSAYKEAVAQEYRFFSFGDAMFIY